MRQYKKIIAFMGALFVVIAIFEFMGHQEVNAQRNIYIGDILQIEVSSSEFSKEELIEAFKGFELIDVTSTKKGQLITLRTEETGTKSIVLGNQKIDITVISTLSDIKRDEIYDIKPMLMESSTSVPWLWIFISSAIVFLGLLIVVIMGILKNKKIKEETALKRCINNIKAIDLNKSNGLGLMTIELKSYVQTKFSIKIIGKTTEEFKVAIEPVGITQTLQEDILLWLKDCDYYKFSGNLASQEKKELFKSNVMELVSNIDNEVVV